MSKIIDVTVPLSAALPTYPGDPRFQFEFTGRIADGAPCNVSRVSLGSHTGTHVDAPYHFLADGASVDQLPLEILIGKCRVVEVSDRERVERAQLEAYDLRDDLRLLIKTRMSGQLRQPQFQEDFVYLTPDAATYLVLGRHQARRRRLPLRREVRLQGLRRPPRAARGGCRDHRGPRSLAGGSRRLRAHLPAAARGGADVAPARVVLRFELDCIIGLLFTIPELMNEMGYDTVFIATGAGSPKFMGIPGEAYNGVVSANELLTRVNLMQGFRQPLYDTPVGMGKRVAVIGAGNTAMDAMRVSLRMGAEKVYLVYRRSIKESPARAEELHHAIVEGVICKWLTNPVRILGNQEGWVTGMEVIEWSGASPTTPHAGVRSPKPGPNISLTLTWLSIRSGQALIPSSRRARPA